MVAFSDNYETKIVQWYFPPFFGFQEVEFDRPSIIYFNFREEFFACLRST